MSSHIYRGGESIEYPSLGFLAEPGETYELPDGVDVPADGRWDSADTPEPAPEPAPVPAPEPAPVPDPAPATDTTIGD